MEFNMAWYMCYAIGTNCTNWIALMLTSDACFIRRSLLNQKAAGCRKNHQDPVSISDRRLIVRSRKVSKPRDLYLKLYDRLEIGQALRQQCCRRACQISERCCNLNYQSRGFETSRDLTIRRLIRYWNGALRVTFCYSDSAIFRRWLHESVGKICKVKCIASMCRFITLNMALID